MIRRLTVLAFTALVLIGGGGGCKKGSSPRVASTQPSAGTLNVYIWSEYLPPPVAQKFTDQTGIELKIDTFDGNEQVYEKLKSGVADYDIVVPSDYMVATLISEKLLQPIDRAKLTNFANLDPQRIDQPYDSGNKFSVPYLYGITGLAYNKTKVAEPVESWAVLFDPKYSNQISMLNDVRECFTVALKRMGKSLNETDPKTLAQAAEMLKQQRKLVKLYDAEDFANKLASGDVWLAHGYTGQLAKAAHEDDQKRLVVIMPKEGGTVAVDNLCIPVTSKRAEMAHRFINFVLEAQNAADIANGTYYASPNAAAKKLIHPELLSDPMIYPTPDILKRCEYIKDVGAATQEYDRLWGQIKG
jgi:spermidine/putrescine-binding protein